jgi:hypothetical protein
LAARVTAGLATPNSQIAHSKQIQGCHCP